MSTDGSREMRNPYGLWVGDEPGAERTAGTGSLSSAVRRTLVVGIAGAGATVGLAVAGQSAASASPFSFGGDFGDIGFSEPASDFSDSSSFLDGGSFETASEPMSSSFEPEPMPDTSTFEDISSTPDPLPEPEPLDLGASTEVFPGPLPEPLDTGASAGVLPAPVPEPEPVIVPEPLPVPEPLDLSASAGGFPEQVPVPEPVPVDPVASAVAFPEPVPLPEFAPGPEFLPAVGPLPTPEPVPVVGQEPVDPGASIADEVARLLTPSPTASPQVDVPQEVAQQILPPQDVEPQEVEPQDVPAAPVASGAVEPGTSVWTPEQLAAATAGLSISTRPQPAPEVVPGAAALTQSQPDASGSAELLSGDLTSRTTSPGPDGTTSVSGTVRGEVNAVSGHANSTTDADGTRAISNAGVEGPNASVMLGGQASVSTAPGGEPEPGRTVLSGDASAGLRLGASAGGATATASGADQLTLSGPGVTAEGGARLGVGAAIPLGSSAGSPRIGLDAGVSAGATGRVDTSSSSLTPRAEATVGGRLTFPGDVTVTIGGGLRNNLLTGDTRPEVRLDVGASDAANGGVRVNPDNGDVRFQVAIPLGGGAPSGSRAPARPVAEARPPAAVPVLATPADLRTPEVTPVARPGTSRGTAADLLSDPGNPDVLLASAGSDEAPPPETDPATSRAQQDAVPGTGQVLAATGVSDGPVSADPSPSGTVDPATTDSATTDPAMTDPAMTGALERLFAETPAGTVGPLLADQPQGRPGDPILLSAPEVPGFAGVALPSTVEDAAATTGTSPDRGSGLAATLSVPGATVPGATVPGAGEGALADGASQATSGYRDTFPPSPLVPVGPAGDVAAGPPALRPDSRYPLCGSGVPDGCIDPVSLRDEDGDGVADNAGALRDGLVGPATVGPATVGPRLVGPRLVGPRLVGPATVGPATVGPAPVGSALPFSPSPVAPVGPGGDVAVGPPALRPDSRYPLCGSGAADGCIDPVSLRDEDGDGVADNAGALRDGLVGPAVVGPVPVGPVPVGPVPVGPVLTFPPSPASPEGAVVAEPDGPLAPAPVEGAPGQPEDTTRTFTFDPAAPNPWKGPIYAGTGAVASWYLQRGINPGLTLGQYAPNATRGFVQDNIFINGAPCVQTGHDWGDALLRGLCGAGASQALSVGTRRIVNPALNAAADTLNTDPRSIALSRTTDADTARLLVDSLRVDPPPPRANVRADFGLGTGRLDLPLLDPRAITLSPDPAANTSPARLDVGLLPDAPDGFPATGSSVAAAVDTARARGAVPAPQGAFPDVPEFRTPTRTGADGPLTVDPVPPFPTYDIDPISGKPRQGNYSIFDMRDLPQDMQTPVQRATDLSVAGMNIGGALAHEGYNQFLESQGQENNYPAYVTGHSLINGLAVGTAVSAGERRLVGAAFLHPTWQSAAAQLISDAVLAAAPAPVRQTVADACSDENPVINAGLWFVCNMGQKPNQGGGLPPTTPPDGMPAGFATAGAGAGGGLPSAIDTAPIDTGSVGAARTDGDLLGVPGAMSPALRGGSAGTPALRPDSRYPLCGPGVPDGCIDPVSLRDEDGDGVADNAGSLQDGLVGPATVGPRLVGPAVVGPKLVGPAIVGPKLVGPALVGPAIVGPKLVGPAIVGPAIVGPAIVGPAIVGPGSAPAASSTAGQQVRPASPGSQPAQQPVPAPAAPEPTWQDRAAQVGGVMFDVLTYPHPLDPFRGSMRDVWRYVPGLPMPAGQGEFAH